MCRPVSRVSKTARSTASRPITPRIFPKRRSWSSPIAPFGIIGLECALPLYVKALVEPGHISWMKLIELMTINPARIVKLHNKGTLKPGADGDVTIINPNHAWKIDVEEFAGKSRNCPFHAWKVKGLATHTIVGGEVKWEVA